MALSPVLLEIGQFGGYVKYNMSASADTNSTISDIMSDLLDTMSSFAYIAIIEQMRGVMTQKELEAWVMVLSAIVITGWVWWDATHGGVPADLSGAAWKMVWAVGYSILFNIVAVILGHILFAIFTGGRNISDEKSDERDRLINGKAMRNGYLVLSIGVLGVLIWQGLGLPAVLGPYALFGISMLAGGAMAASQIVYYRIS